MNEQIIITYGNSAIELEVSLINSKKKPINITGYSVEIDFISPSNNKKTVQGAIVDEVNGICSYILEPEFTSEEGLWETYWNCYDEYGYLTTQEAVYYFILPKNGGA